MSSVRIRVWTYFATQLVTVTLRGRVCYRVHAGPSSLVRVMDMRWCDTCARAAAAARLDGPLEPRGAHVSTLVSYLVGIGHC